MPVPYRQKLLLLGAVILPSVLVIVLGVRMLRQESELERKRQAERREAAIGLVRQELQTRLDTLQLRAASGQAKPGGPLIALVARVESGRILLPWNRPAAPHLDQHLLQLRHPPGALKVLRADLGLADEYGLPLALYAARRLASDATPDLRQELRTRIETILLIAWLSPAAAHMAAETAGMLDAPSLRDTALARARDGEQAEQLAPQAAAQDPSWRLSGRTPWFVNIAGETLVAVRAEPVLAAIHLPDHGQWLLAESRRGQALGESFPGLRYTLPGPPAEPPLAARDVFYLSGLLLLLSITAFTAYLLHRDVRRESQLAALRSQFVSSVSHELKTPIASIRAFAELLDLGRARGEQEKSEYLKTILGESERLSRLVDGVLEFSRIEQGKRVYRLQPIALDEVLRSAAHALDYLLIQGRFELRTHIDPAVPKVPADRDALEQAVLNLLGNAIKYSGDDRRIDLTLSLEHNNAVIRVRDRGIGIPLEEQPRIFERFHRAPDSERRNIPGAGLGLALVDHIVKAHGGRVAVESSPGAGSTFSILLPVEVNA